MIINIKNVLGLMMAIVLILAPGIFFGQSVKAGNSSGRLRIASCQFPVSADIESNYRWIEKQMVEAKLKRADIVHFSECALSGYPGTDMPSMKDFNWKQLRNFTDSVLTLAKKLDIWVALGSIHRQSGQPKPYNSLYLISNRGEIADRYDKRFCTTGDLLFFSSGDHFVNFELNAVKCGLLICYDVRFPELYRAYRKAGTEVIFHSFHNARMPKDAIHPVIMPVTAQGSAASNFLYMSLTNSSVPESWPCYFITPDGLIQNKLTENTPGVLISDVDRSEKYYDASEPFRADIMNGKMYSGERVKDTTSSSRKGAY